MLPRLVKLENAEGMVDVVCRELLICLLPFAACFFLGTGIGVGVGRDEDPWVDVVQHGLIAGEYSLHATQSVCRTPECVAQHSQSQCVSCVTHCTGFDNANIAEGGRC